MKIKRIKGVKYRIRMNRIVPTPFAFFTIILTNPLLVNQKMKKSLTSICIGLLSKKCIKGAVSIRQICAKGKLSKKWSYVKGEA